MALWNAPHEEHFVRGHSTIRETLKNAKYLDKEVSTWSKQQIDNYLKEIANEAFTIKARFVKNLSKTSYTHINCIPCKFVTYFDGDKTCLFLRRDMKLARNRFYSFIEMKWSVNISTSVYMFVEAGFFYEGDGDAVRCFSCNGQIRHWEGRSAPMDEHSVLYPECEFVRRHTQFLSRTMYKSDPGCTNGLGDDATGEPSMSLLDINSTLETQSYFKSEFNRLLSYQHWSEQSYVHASDLAASGFYCITGSPNVVECFVCGGRIANWRQGDEPYRRHLEMFPNCPFIRNEEIDNQNITGNEKEQFLVFSSRMGRNWISDRKETFTNFSEGTSNNISEESKKDPFFKYAKYQHFYREGSRLESFSSWPLDHYQQPAKLARAGFYSTQNGDETKCFYCGGGLQNWSSEKDPWEEHARWFSRCDWLLQQRGSSFVETVKKKFTTADGRRSPENALAPVPTETERIMINRELAEQAAKKNEATMKSNNSIEQELQLALETDMAKFMLDMGHRITTIRSVFRKQLEAGHNLFMTSEDLLLAIEEEINKGNATSEPKLELSSTEHAFTHVDGNRCFSCEYKPIEIVTVPCNHSVVCEDCSAKLQVCLICGQPIELVFFIASLRI